MKLLIFLTLFLGIALALETASLEARQRRSRKKANRPRKFSGAGAFRAANRPAGAPADYKTSIGKASRKRSRDGLKRVPPEFIDPVQRLRRREFETLQQLRRQVSASDFFECYNAVRPLPLGKNVDESQFLTNLIRIPVQPLVIAMLSLTRSLARATT